MAATEVGVHYPDGEDAFAPHTDMRLLAESLTPMVVGQFASTADRDTAIPDPVDGMVCTTGTGTGLQFWACQGGEWADMLAVIGGDTGWVALTASSGFEWHPSRPGVARSAGSLVQLVGMVRGAGGSNLAANASHTVCVLPAGFYPASAMYLPASTNTGQSVAGMVVGSTGIVQVRTADMQVPWATITATFLRG